MCEHNADPCNYCDGDGQLSVTEYFWNGSTRLTFVYEVGDARLVYPNRVIRALEEHGTADHGWSTVHLHYKSESAPTAPWVVTP